MSGQEIIEHFKTEVYKAHPEYEMELISISNSPNAYLLVHLGNEYCYFFLLIIAPASKDIKLVNPSSQQLKEFMDKDCSNCVLKKVYVLQIDQDKIINKRVFQPDID